MGLPLAAGLAAWLVVRPARQAAGFSVPGVVFGRLCGCLTFVVLAALSWVAGGG
jgi:hypothetical protein